MNNHEKYIQRCIELAKKGIGTARPNPSVGAVIVYKDTIIGEGYTSAYGGNHAEVNAIAAVKDTSLLQKATLYVTLEPCAHYGKTPPCANLIVQHKIPNVVIGCIDTNSLVAGKGVEILQKGGCSVVVGVLEAACTAQHKRFFTVQNKKRPYIILKWAATADGFIAPVTKDTQTPVWISNKYSQQLVHKWRAEEHAILVGTNTVLADNPKLNVRSWSGNNPVRIVLDRNLRIPENLHVFDQRIQTIVITDVATKIKENSSTVENASKLNNNEKFKETIVSSSGVENIVYEQIDFSSHIAEQIVTVLQKHTIQSIIIEGGRQTLQTFIDANLWDEARVFKGKNNFKTGVKAPKVSGKIIEQKSIDTDVLKIYMND